MADYRIDPKIMEMLKYPWLYQYKIPEELLKTLSPVPPAVFEFDTAGSTQGFAGDYIRDDKDMVYGPPITVSQFPSAQYNKPFPLPPGSTPPMGVIIPIIGQFGSFVQTFNFPKSSAYWYLDVVSPGLSFSSPWQNLNGVEAWFFDQYSVGGSFMSVEIYITYRINGISQKMSLPNATTKLQFNTWVQVKSSIPIGQNMTLENLVLRLKGEWADNSLPGKERPLYEGQILIDHIGTL